MIAFVVCMFLLLITWILFEIQDNICKVYDILVKILNKK